MSLNWLLGIGMAVALGLGMTPIEAGEKALTLLNVSYDPTREPY